MDFYQFSVPTKILFQAGIAKDFSHELSLLKVKRCCVVTDKGLADSKLIHPVVAGLKAAGCEVVSIFTDVPSNSELQSVKKCAERAGQAKADSWVAIGGGSVMDTAKAANILLTHGGSLLADYSGANTIPGPLKPLVAIPTTAGTGSEVSSAAVILDAVHKTKLSFVDPHLAPHLAILDPELTLGLPSRLTAATGMDAMTHAIESIVSIQRNPFSDACAEKAIVLIHEHLLAAVKEGTNITARSGMLTAAALAGIAFDHAMVGVVHAMAHATGGLCGVHHGTANSIFLPWGIEYNWAVAKEPYERVAKAMGLKSAKDLIPALQKFQKDLYTACGLPYRLRDTGLVKVSDLETIAEAAVNDGTSFYNPREVVKEEILKQVKKAW